VGLPWGSRRTRWRRTWPEVLCPLGGALAAAETDSARRLTMLHGGRGKRWQAASGLLHGDGLRCAQPGGEEQAMQALRRWRGEMGNGVTPFGAGRREEGGMRCSARLQGGEMVGCARRKWAALRRNRAGSRRGAQGSERRPAAWRARSDRTRWGRGLVRGRASSRAGAVQMGTRRGRHGESWTLSSLLGMRAVRGRGGRLGR
jgi:hypothetical protein